MMVHSSLIILFACVLVTGLGSLAAMAVPVKPLCISFYDSSQMSPLLKARPATRALLNRLIVLDLGETFAKRGDRYQAGLQGQVDDLRPFVEDFVKIWNKMPLAEQHKERAIITSSIKAYPELSLFFNFGASVDQTSYFPIEAAIEREIYRKLVTYIRLLPRDLHFRLARPKYDATVAQSIGLGVELVKKLEKNFEELFFETEGISYDTYVQRLRRSEDKMIQKAVEFVERGHIDLVMHRQERRREDILISGFLNQFVTGTSGGSLSPEMRNQTESLMLNVPSVDYVNYSVHVKPKYGTVRAADLSGVKDNSMMSEAYGSDIYVFKTPDIEQRLTFYPEDSLSRQEGLGSLGSGPNWTKRMIPWKFRYLMIPFMLEGLQNSALERPKISRAKIPAEANLKLIESMKNDYIPDSNIPDFQGAYWEVQYMGVLTLRNVKEFIFLSLPPSGRFLRELRQNEITITDGRYDPPRPWNEFDKSAPVNSGNYFLGFPGDGLGVLPGVPSFPGTITPGTPILPGLPTMPPLLPMFPVVE
ncbi:MAG: hypothetical protein JNL11_09510 [Bdellovibrionaceae bacterium]|nr:hypothetical protein [Pseudobdellovibrionaceae bacterium]